MKNLLLILAVAMSFCSIHAQDFTALQAISMTAPGDFKSAEPKVLAATNYLFTNPADLDKDKRLAATQFIMRWMEGTPDYTFAIDADAMKLTEGSADLLGLYLAGMTKAVLEYNGEPLTDEEISKRAEALLVSYVADEKNNIKPNKTIKKLLKQKD
ncbi:MAG: hypothetical protein KKC03_01490 [Bacteroidetes bacterium]|nr:hypothetical protein [Bacteroidota bacterium]